MFTVAIQSGGESRRMGQDKALLSFLGEPLISHVMKRVSALADEVLVTTNRPQGYRFLGVPLIPDSYPGAGALGGLYTALEAAHHELVGVVACDMPFASASLLALARDRLLAEGVDVAIPTTPQGYEPFHAVYRRAACLPAVKRALEAGERRLISWFPEVRVYALPPEDIRRCDPRGIAFWNLNTAEEFRQAEELARQMADC